MTGVTSKDPARVLPPEIFQAVLRYLKRSRWSENPCQGAVQVNRQWFEAAVAFQWKRCSALELATIAKSPRRHLYARHVRALIYKPVTVNVPRDLSFHQLRHLSFSGVLLDECVPHIFPHPVLDSAWLPLELSMEVASHLTSVRFDLHIDAGMKHFSSSGLVSFFEKAQSLRSVILGSGFKAQIDYEVWCHLARNANLEYLELPTPIGEEGGLRLQRDLDATFPSLVALKLNVQSQQTIALEGIFPNLRKLDVCLSTPSTVFRRRRSEIEYPLFWELLSNAVLAVATLEDLNVTFSQGSITQTALVQFASHPHLTRFKVTCARFLHLPPIDIDQISSILPASSCLKLIYMRQREGPPRSDLGLDANGNPPDYLIQRVIDKYGHIAIDRAQDGKWKCDQM